MWIISHEQFIFSHLVALCVQRDLQSSRALWGSRGYSDAACSLTASLIQGSGFNPEETRQTVTQAWIQIESETMELWGGGAMHCVIMPFAYAIFNFLLEVIVHTTSVGWLFWFSNIGLEINILLPLKNICLKYTVSWIHGTACSWAFIPDSVRADVNS